MTTNIPEWVNVSQAADLLGCTVGRIRQKLIANQLHGWKANKRAWLISRSEIERELREKKARTV